MRKLWPNSDREDGLETVLEIPIPEESFAPSKQSGRKTWQGIKSLWTKQSSGDTDVSGVEERSAEIQLLLGVVGAPLVPVPVECDRDCVISKNIKDHPIECSMAKYILKQYIAAIGGEKALSSIESMCAMGKVKMGAPEFYGGDERASVNKAVKVRNGGGEMGGFVLWQKRPELWCLELVASGCKISAGSDGEVAWRQTPWQHSHASRGPPRPLRRLLQGLDPGLVASLFSNSVCTGEKMIGNEGCFILKLDAAPSTLRARSSSSTEMIRHTMWGYFSQKTGLLVQLEDSHLLRIKTPENNSIYWETTMQSLIQDYRTIDGIGIAHSGKTQASLFRFGEDSESHSRTRMEEVWSIEEIDFNIKGLAKDCFLPPSDLKNEEDSNGIVACSASLPVKIRSASFRVGTSKVVAVDMDDMLIVGKNTRKFAQLEEELSKSFAMKDLGLAKQILGMKIIRDRKGKKLCLSQVSYVKKVLPKFNMSKAKSVSPPFARSPPFAGHFELMFRQVNIWRKFLTFQLKVA